MQRDKQKPAPQPSPAPAPAPRGIFRWLHQESDIHAVCAQALETAKRGTWMSLDRASRTRQFRALVVLTLRLAALSWRPVPLGQLGPHLYSTPERNAAASAITRTLTLLAPEHIRPTSDIATQEAQPATGSIETGAIHIATIILVTACAVAAAWLGTVIAQAVHAVNFDDEITKRMLAAHARALEILSMHVERERIAGHELPFDETERAWLLGLEDVQRRLATLMHRPLPSPFQGATELVRAGTGMLPVAMLGIALFFLIKQQNERRS